MLGPSYLHLVICQCVENLIPSGGAALPRVAGLPVGDLARLAAVATRVAAAADGEGGLVLVALDAANVARPTLSPSKLGAPRFVRQSSPRSSLALHATVKNGAARTTASEVRMSLSYLLLATPTTSARPPSSEPIIFKGQREGRGRVCAEGNVGAAVKTQTRHFVDRSWQREFRAITHGDFFQRHKATERVR